MKKNYLLSLILGLFINFSAQATHIVGGEFELIHLNSFNFNLRLNLYFDDINGNPGAEDESITVYIFSKSNNQLLRTITLPQFSQELVEYSNPECTTAQLRTRLFRYAQEIFLDPSTYNEPEGYYVIWERCCRNETIANIVDPGGTGISFYLEFPPVIQGGFNFFNSSPRFRTPVGDFLCVDQSVEFDFGASDVDGDQLVYSLVSPIAGNSRPVQGLIVPPPFAAPYDSVQWQNNFSANRAIPSDIAFSENQFSVNPNTGLLKVTPDRPGLFVFAVRCEEFRNGVKISEVRRDFQLMVLDCPSNESPSIQIQNNNQGPDVSFYQEGEVIELSPENGELCFSLWLKDSDPNERLLVSMRGINFQARPGILSTNQGTVRNSNDSLEVQFCWPECIYSPLDASGNPELFIFDLEVRDDRCPSSQADIIRVQLRVPEPPDELPTVSTNAPIGDQECDYIWRATVGEVIDFQAFAADVDNDFIFLEAQGQGFDLAALNMQFEEVSGFGSLESRFTWNTDCAFQSAEEVNFIINFITRSESTCEGKADTTKVKLIVQDLPINLEEFLPPNAFTPNGDSFNPNFTLPNLPDENCRFQFKNIEIFNRWGNLVYRAEERDFAWDGGDFPSGAYFYQIDYKSKIYKGWLELIR